MARLPPALDAVARSTQNPAYTVGGKVSYCHFEKHWGGPILESFDKASLERACGILWDDANAITITRENIILFTSWGNVPHVQDKAKGVHPRPPEGRISEDFTYFDWAGDGSLGFTAEVVVQLKCERSNGDVFYDYEPATEGECPGANLVNCWKNNNRTYGRKEYGFRENQIPASLANLQAVAHILENMAILSARIKQISKPESLQALIAIKGENLISAPGA